MAANHHSEGTGSQRQRPGNGGANRMLWRNASAADTVQIRRRGEVLSDEASALRSPQAKPSLLSKCQFRQVQWQNTVRIAPRCTRVVRKSFLLESSLLWGSTEYEFSAASSSRRRSPVSNVVVRRSRRATFLALYSSTCCALVDHGQLVSSHHHTNLLTPSHRGLIYAITTKTRCL